MFSVIDIETTGGSYLNDKITEIAIYIHDGEKIVDEYSTLINPEKYIPNFITAMTGISNEMVADAPKFFEVARHIVELTDGKVFVAHNVGFDYNFVRHEFKRLGYEYTRKQLCTVKLSRKLIPGKRSYSLGNLCNDLDIRIENRHRAAGDALATVKLFELLLKTNGKDSPNCFNDPYLLKGLNPSINEALIDKLPEDTGVYYFYNQKGDIIYIGKSKNIRKRVLTHLANNKLLKAMEMKNQLHDISYEITGSELIALLMESEEIKTHRPVFNRSQRQVSFHYGLFFSENEQGYLCLNIARNNRKNLPVTTFISSFEASDFMFYVTEKFHLCQKLNGLYESQGSCFQHGIGQCAGACIGKEPVDEYNQRVQAAIDYYRVKQGNMLIYDKGRNNNEKSVVMIENGNYLGYCYMDYDSVTTDPEFVRDCIRSYRDNRDVQAIIRNYLNQHKVEKIIRF
ncbi:MAG: exonuclease domain-containing protein [Bacteroidia bacterium]|nr:exonuclease domain-containing protein [Bacteroidia bacterium]